MRAELAKTLALLRGVPDTEAGRCHPPYTWTIRQVVGHLIDCERIMAYRALRFARGDTTPLPGFDQNAYVPIGEFDRRPLAELAGMEFEAVRQSHLHMFGDFPEGSWDRRGVANDTEMKHPRPWPIPSSDTRGAAAPFCGSSWHRLKALEGASSGGPNSRRSAVRSASTCLNGISAVSPRLHLLRAYRTRSGLCGGSWSPRLLTLSFPNRLRTESPVIVRF